jgi:hypothetical protein
MKSQRTPSGKSAIRAASKPAPAPKSKLPHVREQSPGSVGTEPRKVIQQAYKDIQAGLVDTDMRATPGLDAQRRKQLVKPAAK